MSDDLWEAVLGGDIGKAQSCIASGADVNFQKPKVRNMSDIVYRMLINIVVRLAYTT